VLLPELVTYSFFAAANESFINGAAISTAEMIDKAVANLTSFILGFPP
jgi:hypothetical protein